MTVARGGSASVSPSPAPAFGAAVLIGAAGLVGRLLGRLLAEVGTNVVGLDVLDVQAASAQQQQQQQQSFAHDWIVGDAKALDERAKAALATADLVLVCLPEPAALAALPAILQASSSQALIVDTLSVKQRVASLAAELQPRQEYLSINPLFSPKVGFAHQNVAVVEVNRGEKSAAFQSLLESWGARCTVVDARQHDRSLALAQAATHMAIIALGLTMHEWNYDVHQALSLGTPPHRICLALAARIADAAPEVYWDIQAGNPYAADARRSLAENLRRVSQLIDHEDEAAFEQEMSKLGALTAPLRQPLLAAADSLAAASRLAPPSSPSPSGRSQDHAP